MGKARQGNREGETSLGTKVRQIMRRTRDKDEERQTEKEKHTRQGGDTRNTEQNGGKCPVEEKPSGAPPGPEGRPRNAEEK